MHGMWKRADRKQAYHFNGKSLESPPAGNTLEKSFSKNALKKEYIRYSNLVVKIDA